MGSKNLYEDYFSLAKLKLKSQNNINKIERKFYI